MPIQSHRSSQHALCEVGASLLELLLAITLSACILLLSLEWLISLQKTWTQRTLTDYGLESSLLLLRRDWKQQSPLAPVNLTQDPWPSLRLLCHHNNATGLPYWYWVRYEIRSASSQSLKLTRYEAPLRNDSPTLLTVPDLWESQLTFELPLQSIHWNVLNTNILQIIMQKNVKSQPHTLYLTTYPQTTLLKP